MHRTQMTHHKNTGKFLHRMVRIYKVVLKQQRKTSTSVILKIAVKTKKKIKDIDSKLNATEKKTTSV